MRVRSLISTLAVACFGLLVPSSAHAFVMKLTPLAEVVEREFIFVAKVSEVLPDKPGMVLMHLENLKGKAPFDRMPINLTGDAFSKKGKHTELMLDRVEKDLPIVIIATFVKPKYVAFGYTNGTWFSMEGRIDKEEGKETVRWAFLHAEPYLRRTFKGTTEEMKRVIADALAKKKDPPEPNDKELPGFGDPIRKKSELPQSPNDVERAGGVFPVLGVVQLPFIGLIAGLAALFPTVFGGLALFMKRWVAVLSIGGIVSILVTLPLFLPGWCGRQWIFSVSGLWLTCAVLFTLGALWSIRRYRLSFNKGTSDSFQPRKFDRIFVTVLLIAGLTALAIGAACRLPLWTNDAWRWVIAATAGFAVAGYVVFIAWLRARQSAQITPLRVAPETVLLWVLVGTCLTYGAYEAGRYSDKSAAIVKGSGGAGQPTLNGEVIWKFEPQEGGVVVSTCATYERIYVAVMINEKGNARGRVYALDPGTGSEIWRFDNNYDDDSDKGMKPAFSAPVFADGRLYFGEGLHTDFNSRLFCLDAATGKKQWEYATESHTESSPMVADGKVVIGAGYHGLHCVDAVNGPGPNNTPLWRVPKTGKAEDREWHVDCNPCIANGKVYFGSGYKPEYVAKEGRINRISCVDLNTGNEVWTKRVDDAVYGSPIVVGDRVFYGTGNSTYYETFPSKNSGILCRDAKTGEMVWDRVLPEGVIGKPVADKRQLFVGCLDGNAYALDLRTGEINWTVQMGAKVLAGPVAEIDNETGCANVVYFAGDSGNLQAVVPYTGGIYWSVPVQYWAKQPIGDLSATPTMLKIEDEKIVRHRLFIGFGQGRSGSTIPKLYCIEDTVKKTAD